MYVYGINGAVLLEEISSIIPWVSATITGQRPRTFREDAVMCRHLLCQTAAGRTNGDETRVAKKKGRQKPRETRETAGWPVTKKAEFGRVNPRSDRRGKHTFWDLTHVPITKFRKLLMQTQNQRQPKKGGDLMQHLLSVQNLRAFPVGLWSSSICWVQPRGVSAASRMGSSQGGCLRLRHRPSRPVEVT